MGGEDETSEPAIVEMDMKHTLSSAPSKNKSKFHMQSLNLDTRLQSTEFDSSRKDDNMINVEKFVTNAVWQIFDITVPDQIFEFKQLRFNLIFHIRYLILYRVIRLNYFMLQLTLGSSQLTSTIWCREVDRGWVLGV